MIQPTLFDPTTIPVEPIGPILAATAWEDNADLILACARLGYLRDHDRVLDPTYENGTWWKRWRPEALITHNRDIDGSDFRDLPYEDDSFDAAAYDPPYVCVGGRDSTGIPEFHARYGMEDAPRTPAALQLLVNAGLAEMHRLVKPKGIVLVKCQDYVSSGKLFLGTHWTLTHALDLGFVCIDRLEHVSYARPQPTHNLDGSLRRQVHAHRNLSTLFVLQKRSVRW